MITSFRHWARLEGLIVLATFIMSAATPAKGADAIETTKLEAAFIYQFTNYVEWPDRGSAQGTTNAAFVISVIGNPLLVKELRSIAHALKVRERPIELKEAAGVSDLERSEIVILETQNMGMLRNLLGSGQVSHALTVTHAEGFAKNGAMINFFIENGRLRFEINRDAVQRAGLKVSSQLLQLARIVEP